MSPNRHAFIPALAEIVGIDNVESSEKELEDWRDPYDYRGTHRRKPLAVVSPASTEEVQAIVRAAGVHKVPLWSFSTGRNYGYGGPASATAHAVLVSLRRMNRILEVNEESAYAVVEPGVRFFDLYEALGERGHTLWPSIPDLGWGSVVGNTLEHGVGFTPLGDHPMRQCGMEVVLADGTVLRTGMGAMEGNRASYHAKRGFGPSADGLFMQSNFGIVTKMGVWLTPRPEVFMSCDVRIEREEDLPALVDLTRKLLLDSTLQNSPIIYNTLRIARAFGGVGREYWYTGEGSIPDEGLDEMASQLDCGRWFMRFALYGRREVVNANFGVCERTFGEIPDARVEGRLFDGASVPTELGEDTLGSTQKPSDALKALRHQCAAVQAGVPSLTLLENVRWEDASVAGHLDYSPVAPTTGPEAERVVTMLQRCYLEAGMDLSASLMISARSFTTISMLWYDTEDAEAVAAAKTFLRTLIKTGAEHGYAPYRSHLDVMDEVAHLFDFGHHALSRFNNRIKYALDPAGILSPGKQGIL
ncbi:FAD-binding oxidoreductase [Qaidamihabitans albus]|uniref:FAD-binding oxidoreductase n=1 Tax=Qaidamihabitans albus TaxID=2795733 RepID=UPI0018F239A7|nr:FAD-binding oxidoreductase [Qaidamihabitans albus]